MRTQKYLFLVQEFSYYTARTQQEQDGCPGPPAAHMKHEVYGSKALLIPEGLHRVRSWQLRVLGDPCLGT